MAAVDGIGFTPFLMWFIYLPDGIGMKSRIGLPKIHNVGDSYHFSDKLFESSVLLKDIKMFYFLKFPIVYLRQRELYYYSLKV